MNILFHSSILKSFFSMCTAIKFYEFYRGAIWEAHIHPSTQTETGKEESRLAQGLTLVADYHAPKIPSTAPTLLCISRNIQAVEER